MIQAPAVLIYGASGVGKTVAAMRALRPDKTVWISTERGALKPASNPDLNPWHPARPAEIVCLHAPTGRNDTAVFVEFEAAITHVVAEVARGNVWNVVIDTLSSYMRRLDYLIRELVGVGREYGRAADAMGTHLMPHLDRIHQMCATVARPGGVMGATLVCLCHERDPFQAAPDKRTGAPARSEPGGPDLPGALRKKVRHDFDLVLRMDTRYVSQKVESVFLHDSGDKLLPTKDRYGVVPDRRRGEAGMMPADLGAVLRAGVARDFGGTPREEDLAVIRSYQRPVGDGVAKDLLTL